MNSDTYIIIKCYTSHSNIFRSNLAEKLYILNFIYVTMVYIFIACDSGSVFVIPFRHTHTHSLTLTHDSLIQLGYHLLNILNFYYIT